MADHIPAQPRLRNPAGRAGAPCGERIGWIEAWAGPYRPTYARERKKEGTVKKTGGARQRVGQRGGWLSQRRAENRRGHETIGSDRWWRKSGQVQRAVKYL